VSGWVYPVFDPTAYEPPDLENPDPFHPPSLTMAPLIQDKPQTVVSRYDAIKGVGWALKFNPEMQLEFAIDDGTGPLMLVTISEQVRGLGGLRKTGAQFQRTHPGHQGFEFGA
jgi:hypothetical protein